MIKILQALALLVGLSLCALASSGGASKSIFTTVPGFRYVLIGRWEERATDGYIFLSNDLVQGVNYCLYRGNGVFVKRAGGKFLETRREKGNAVIFTSSACPTISGAFVGIGRGVPLQDLDQIKDAVDVFWHSACRELHSDKCRIFAPDGITYIEFSPGFSAIEVRYGLTSSILVRKVEGKYIAEML